MPTTTLTSLSRIRRHSSARSPSLRPAWSTATSSAVSVRKRSSSGVARATSGTSTRAPRPSRRAAETGGHVDRRLAGSRHAIEEEGRRGPRLDRADDRGRRRRLVLVQGHARRPGRRVTIAIRVRQPVGDRGLELDQPSRGEAGDGTAAEARRDLRRRHGRPRIVREHRDRRSLSGAQRSSAGGPILAARRPTLRGQADEAHVPAMHARRSQLPGQIDGARGSQRAQASDGGRAISRAGQAGDRDASRAGIGDPRQQLAISGGQLARLRPFGGPAPSSPRPRPTRRRGRRTPGARASRVAARRGRPSPPAPDSDAR